MQTVLKNDFTIIFDWKDKNKKRGKQKSLLLILVKLHALTKKLHALTKRPENIQYTRNRSNIRKNTFKTLSD